MNEKILQKIKDENPTCSNEQIEVLYLLEKKQSNSATSEELSRLFFLFDKVCQKETDPKLNPEGLFCDLEKWSYQKDAYSIYDFLRDREIDFQDLELAANENQKFMEIWGMAETRAWKHLNEAISAKSLPKSKILDYIREADLENDPEEILKNIERGNFLLARQEIALNDNSSASEMMSAAFDCGLISKEEYQFFQRIEAETAEFEDED